MKRLFKKIVRYTGEDGMLFTCIITTGAVFGIIFLNAAASNPNKNSPLFWKLLVFTGISYFILGALFTSLVKWFSGEPNAKECVNKK
jgi:hypothetical protein